VMKRIGLTLNETKTSIKQARREQFDFLGYTFGPWRYRKTGAWYLGLRRSRELTHPCFPKLAQAF
jgi:RNA-directed DNA polymerase